MKVILALRPPGQLRSHPLRPPTSVVVGFALALRAGPVVWIAGIPLR